MDRLIIHASGITEFQQCRRRWWYGDRNSGLGFGPLVDPDPYILGSWIHSALWGYYYGGANPVEMLNWAAAQTVEEWTSRGLMQFPGYLGAKAVELSNLGTAMMEGYVPWAESAGGLFADRNLRSIDIEEAEFSIELPGNIVYAGRWDRLVERKDDGSLWVLEHKTDGARDPNRIHEGVEYDWQPRFYTWAAQQIFGKRVRGVIYNVLRKANPFDIEILQSGLPTANRQKLENKTDHFAYQQVLENILAERSSEEAAEIRVKYLPTLTWLANEVPAFYSRVPLHIPDTYKEAAPIQLAKLGAEMRKAAAEAPDMLPSFNRYSCTFCPFRVACKAHDDGADFMEVLAATMTRKDPEKL